MNAAQFIPAAAAVFGIPETELRTVDRALADAGLREKSAGRHYPEVTRKEAVRLLIGVCASPRLTEADRVVSALENFTGQFPFPTDNDDEFCRASFRFTRMEATAMNFVQAVERVCGWLASTDAPSWPVELEIAVGGMVAFQAHNWDEKRKAEIYFSGVQNYQGYPGVETVRHVRSHALKWIGANTEVRA